MANALNAQQQSDPPLPARANPIRRMTAEESRSATMGMLTIGIAFLIVAGLLWYFRHPIAAGACGVLGLILGASAFSKKSLVSACPFCGAKLTGITEEAATKGCAIRCNECFEYSEAGGMNMRPMDPNKVADKPRFLAPVFEDGVWPQGCVQCGAPANAHRRAHRSLHRTSGFSGAWASLAEQNNDEEHPVLCSAQECG